MKSNCETGRLSFDFDHLRPPLAPFHLLVLVLAACQPIQTQDLLVKSSQIWSWKKYLLQSPRRSEAGSFHPGFQYLSQMEKAATDMINVVKLGPGSSHGHLEVYQRQPHQGG